MGDFRKFSRHEPKYKLRQGTRIFVWRERCRKKGDVLAQFRRMWYHAVEENLGRRSCMEYNKRISAIAPGDEVEGYYILKSANPKVAANGKPFLTGALSDKTGTIELKVWDYPGPLGTGDEGKVVKVRGTAGEYRGTVQFTAGRIRLAAEDDPVDVAALVPTAPIDRTAAMDELRRWAASIEDGDYRAVAEEMLDAHGEALAAIPAAKSVHHAFLGGLLMHTANMMRIADFLAGMYPETIDRSLLLCGTLLHDMAKEREFVFSQLGLATDYSVKGQLLGHLVMGAQEAAETAQRLGVPEEKSVLLQHLILSHHGEPEFGAAVRPLCAEAELLSLIDSVDSRMEIYRETYDTMEPGTFSPRIFALEKKIFRHE
ncbi:MAG TPA: hypothetical protein DHW47_01770 [Oscillibacter sp.]|nr:hypothetical protein [Oscillibacter sp.]